MLIDEDFLLTYSQCITNFSTHLIHVDTQIVQAEIQKITYDDYLPLLGINLPDYEGFVETVNPNAENLASTCAYRVGHTFVSPFLQRISADGTNNPIALEESFFVPNEVNNLGLDPYLRGLSSQVCQESDPHVIDALRTRLFKSDDDLLARNIQRGRDHGLPTLNASILMYCF